MSGMSGEGGRRHLGQTLGMAAAPLFSHDPAAGALPQLLAAIAPQATGGSYWGPSGLLELKGPPKRARIHAHAADPAVAARLWDVSQALTGNPFGDGA
jgi:hypothetical protein